MYRQFEIDGPSMITHFHASKVQLFVIVNVLSLEQNSWGKIGILKSNKPRAKLTICQIWRILSSLTEQMTQGSFIFHVKSEILAVCPAWMKSSSGGPSSASSLVWSTPILLRSQICSRRSVPEEARIVSLWGDHCTY